ncbi:MAG: hypothetical protein HGGPFJEG_00041 [Ignavibacteria bacterium]|nr:hypothetical protein [Ignavibacteria bacterium]
MKIFYIVLYCISALLFIVAMLGSSITKDLFDSYSEKTLEYSGLKKNSVQNIDNKIDDLIYKSKQIELKIERIKNFFSQEKIDESKYQRENTALLQKNIYDPLINMLNQIFRFAMMFVSVVFLMFAVIFHLAYRGIELRKRVYRLEAIVLAGKQS